MNSEYEKQLEAVVRRELDALGELEAPPEIARGVMRVIEQCAALPWYRREWQGWWPRLRSFVLEARNWRATPRSLRRRGKCPGGSVWRTQLGMPSTLWQM